MDTTFTIRQATADDAAAILYFIRAIAEYEKMLDEVKATEESVRESIFGANSNTEALLAYEGEKAVGFAVYFHNYSTFVGRKGLYLEDLFVLPEMRGKGYGKAMLSHLAKIAVERNCGRFEWSVLDWNEPAIKFYKTLGAEPMEEWTVYRITGEPLKKLAGI